MLITKGAYTKKITTLNMITMSEQSNENLQREKSDKIKVKKRN